MCNRVRQPAAEAPDDRGGRAGVREAVGAGVLVCRGCQPRRPAAGGRCARRACPAGKLLLPSVQTCARRRREARAPRLPSKEAGSRDRGRPGVWGQAGSGNWPARDRGWRRPVPERQGAEAEGESEGARDWETGELGLRKRLFVGLGLIVGPLVKPEL